ncbi:MAG TPA: hypothetical protein VFP73_02385 [Terrabacter sp.]|nr:hypothetical protein [Terrabacter sp.]
MSIHDSNDPTVPASDPTADPTSGPTSGPATDPTADPTADPAATTEIPSTSTQALPAEAVPTEAMAAEAMPTEAVPAEAVPAHAPFRVEPSRPVPDDVVTPGSELPHLPPPAASAQPVSRPTPEPAPQPAPRPALVTVHKGPRPGSIMLGLLTVLVAAYLLLANLTHSDTGFAVTGPSFIGAFGGILLLVGLAGVVAGRLRRH